VFDCANRCGKTGTRYIKPMGHIRMMAAAQPFLSGAISKTVNVPESADVADIEQAYIEAWKLGLKAVAIYRDGSKKIQPLNTGRTKGNDHLRNGKTPRRRHLPDERQALTHKFSIGGHEGYLTVGLFEDDTPGELFVRMAKEGSAISGLMDSFATAVSIMLQYGVPLEVLCNKFTNSRFEPSGFTNNPEVPIAKSIMDYIFRWIGIKFMGQAPANAPVEKSMEEVGKANGSDEAKSVSAAAVITDMSRMQTSSDAPPCSECGSVTVPNGSCYRCVNCGATTGCS
jgi:ribonucleoside-diphosphate reductase alpha chain